MAVDSSLLSEVRRLKAEYAKRKIKSGKLFSEARKCIPGAVSSNLRYFSPFPTFFSSAKGSRIKDADGMEYVDYNMSYGALLLGHGHPYVARKARRYLEAYGTTNFGAPVDLEISMAKRIKSIIRSAETMRFCNTGTEAVMLAIRTARGFKRKPLVAKMEGHYHGTYDDVLVSTTPTEAEGGPRGSPRPVTTSRGIPREMFKNTVVLPFNDLESCEKILKRNSKRLSCVIMELVSKGYVPAKKDFAKGMREITDRLDMLLVIDEILTGFREDFRGAQHYYGIRPDLSCFGKAASGGVPLSLVAGREDVMSVVSPLRKGKNYVYHSGTYNGSTIGLSHALANLDAIQRKGTYQKLFANTRYLGRGISAIFEERGIEARLSGLMRSMFNVHFCPNEILCHRDTLSSDTVKRAVFDYTLLLSGVYLVPGRRFNMAAVHSKKDLDRTLDAVEKAASRIKV